MTLAYKNIGIIADKAEEAQLAYDNLLKNNNLIEVNFENLDKNNELEVIIALGGDGFMLQVVHELMDNNMLDIPIYGMNLGTVGFLMNNYSNDDLAARLARATVTNISPLKMTAITRDGEEHSALAVNEVSLLRQSSQAAHIRIKVDDKEMIPCLVSDGVLVATPAGSTAYNSSVGGPVIPLNADLIALTPISPFRPKNWRGALLPTFTKIELQILNTEKRPASAVADSYEVRDVKKVEIINSKKNEIKLLFDEGHSLEERIIREQFL